jgi:fructose/tagatose bisphosphate aldolase
MPVIRKGEHAREILNQLIAENRSLPCFCTESIYTTEAIFKGAKSFKSKAGISSSMPVIIAFTASYEDRQQLKNYTGLANLREGMLAMKADIERLSRPTGPYADLDIIVHLDHAQPGKDDWIINEYSDFISSVMWDCSYFSLEENIRMVREFVAIHKSDFIIEGAVNEIYNYSAKEENLGAIDNITSPYVAESYYNKTGCDLIVANLGTEHRRTEGSVEYHGKVAREITAKIGRRLVLHGTSSIKESALQDLPQDGIAKVNLWGNLEAIPGKKLAETLIKGLEHQLSGDQVKQLVGEAYLNEKMLDKTCKPSIHFLTEKFRRDEVYLPEASAIIERFYKNLFQQ